MSMIGPVEQAGLQATFGRMAEETEMPYGVVDWVGTGKTCIKWES